MFKIRFINNYLHVLFVVLIFNTVFTEKTEMCAKKLLSVNFEVHGKVQGVFFRKYTEKQATSLGLKGWCMNTEKGTVQGVIQGEEEPINSMKKWLQNTGSPSSRIDHADFNNEKEIKKFEYDKFNIRR